MAEALPDHGQFTRLVDEAFTVASEATRQTMRLHSVSDLRRSGAFESFSVVLRGAANTPFAQGNYWVGHETLGDNQLFMVPLGLADGEMEYQLVFSRPLS